MKLLVVNGPNLSRLGRRESLFYGRFTLADVESALQKTATALKARLVFFQSDQEGELVSRINTAGESFDGILINADAYTHTSIALRDALLAAALPFVEVHISNVHAREGFRHRSYLADIAAGVIVGFGLSSYTLGLQGLAEIVRVRKAATTPAKGPRKKRR